MVGQSRADIPGSVFGSIPGIPVGTRWASRKAMSEDHVHPPLVAGIYGRKADGARSVVLAGEFDDEDSGETFTYIGSGGREPGVRFGPQTLDQTFENNLNQALRISAKRQVPVRVLRGPGLRSKYTPYAGFRYDGLYTVHNPRQETAANGHKVCKFDFKRIPGQPPLPEYDNHVPGDIEIRHAQFKAGRKKRERISGSGGIDKPIAAKWEGLGNAPRSNAVASESKAGAAASSFKSFHSRRSGSPVETVYRRSVTPITLSTIDLTEEFDAKELGLEDSDEDEEVEMEEDEEDQEDIFADIDKVMSEFRPIQLMLDEMNRPGGPEVMKARRLLLIDIGNHVRKILSRKLRGDRGHGQDWWRHELWAYVSQYLPTGGRLMAPEHLEGLYEKYKKKYKMKERARDMQRRV